MKKNKLILLLIVTISCVFPTTSMAQETKESFFKKSNITYGGNLGFHLDPHEFNVLIMPEVGYKLFPQWKFAVAPLYSYYEAWDYSGENEEHTLGVRISTNIDFVGRNKTPKFNIFIYLGYQYEHHWINNTSKSEYDINYADIGIGAKYKISQMATAYLLASWHAYSDYICDRYKKNWFPDLIPNITFGIEIN